MNSGKKIQVLKSGASAFTDINIDLNDGYGATMFQDGVTVNIYAMAANSSLKELVGVSGDSWKNAKGDNITDGTNGFIFKDKDGNIYAGGVALD